MLSLVREESFSLKHQSTKILSRKDFSFPPVGRSKKVRNWELLIFFPQWMRITLQLFGISLLPPVTLKGLLPTIHDQISNSPHVPFFPLLVECVCNENTLLPKDYRWSLRKKYEKWLYWGCLPEYKITLCTCLSHLDDKRNWNAKFQRGRSEHLNHVNVNTSDALSRFTCLQFFLSLQIKRTNK